MRSTLLSLVVTSLVSASPDAFAKWATSKGRSYASAEERFLRRSVFATNSAKVAAHNAAGHEWKMGLNAFADLTEDEWVSRYTGGYVAPPLTSAALRGRAAVADSSDVASGSGAAGTSDAEHDSARALQQSSKSRTRSRTPSRSPSRPPAPSSSPAAASVSVDWSATNAIGPVKDQGQCGSCWSFSAVGAIEAAVWIKTGMRPLLSEQQAVDCTTISPYNNAGCNGGWMSPVFSYAKAVGICTSAAYPYTALDGTCKEASCGSILNTDRFFTSGQGTVSNTDAAHTSMLASRPFSVALYVNNAWQLYASGVFSASCPSSSANHAIIMVGYGRESGLDYYKLRNSWGTGWGESGYVKMKRGNGQGGAGQANGLCGVLQASSYPTV